MKIVIVGPGAMGCLLAAFLSRTDNEVWLLDKHEGRARTISANGIRVAGILGDWRAGVHAADDASLIGPADLLIICTKSYDTESALGTAAASIGSDTFILTLQNGAGNVEIISRIAGKHRVIGGITGLGSTLLGDGYINYAGKGETVIGCPGGTMNAGLRRIQGILEDAGIETHVSEDITRIIWSKLVINAGINALTAVTRLKNGQLLASEGTREILHNAASEAAQVAEAQGIHLLYENAAAKVESVCLATAENMSSMLQDVMKRKRTEIDTINGVIVKEGSRRCIPTPVNRMLVHLVKAIEHSYTE